MLLNKTKIVVFDMDETLGYFVELGIFWDSLHNYARSINADTKGTFTQEYFNSVLDIFPEFIRPNILAILQFVKMKKITRQCQSVMIYTNNQGPKEWTYFIKNYFDHKLKYKLFNHVISAFKVNGKQVEFCRTSHDKTIKDFMRCSKMRENIEICYLDDTYYQGMNTDEVYYIKIKPYVYDLDFDSMIERFIKSPASKKLISDKKETETEREKEKSFSEFMKENMNNYEFAYIEKNKEEYEIDKIVAKKTMNHLHFFFNKNKKRTSPPSSGNRKTLKNRVYKSKTKKNR
jgi:hypothetical protein